MTPLQTSEKFWRGIQKKNITLVTIYSESDPKIKAEDLKQLPDVTDVTFGRIIIDAEHAEIETFLTVTLDEEATNIRAKTFLVEKDNKWKVAYQRTMMQVTVNRNIAEIIDGIQELAEGVAEEIEDSVEEIKEKAIPEIESQLEQAEQEWREIMPELKNMINEFIRKLEESIEESLPAEEEPKTQET